LSGQSAGAYSTCDLIASPLAKGLFSRAVMHSGNCNTSRRAKAEAQGDELAAALGCSDRANVLTCLRSKTAKEVAGATMPNYTSKENFNWGPTVDGYFLPEPPSQSFASGVHNHVSLIMGITAIEFSTLWSSVYSSIRLPTSEVDYAADVRTIFGAAYADRLVAAYPASSYASFAQALAMMASDIWFACPNRSYARLISRHQEEPVRRFLFAHAFDSGPARSMGAGHGADLFYAWRIFPVPWWTPSARELALSDTMTDYFARFARAGDPNGEGAPPWLPYEVASDSYLIFDTPVGTGTGMRQSQCDLLEALR
jgi:para-nitrobenzyl esterase